MGSEFGNEATLEPPLSSQIIRAIRVIRGSILPFDYGSSPEGDLRVVPTKLKDLLTADYPPSPWDGLRRGERGSDGWATKIRNPKHEARSNIECSKLKDLSTADPPTPRLRRDRSPGSDGWATKIRNPKHEARNNIECSKLKDLLTADYPPSPWDGLRRGELRSDGWEPERVGFLAAPAFSLIRVIRVIRGSILPFQ